MKLFILAELDFPILYYMWCNICACVYLPIYLPKY